jgi:nitrous oxide reductase
MITRTFIATFALAFAASMSAQASAPVSADAKASITKALAEIGCTSEDIDGEGDVYFADDATCKDGKYDITFDKDFKIVKKEKEND